MEWISVLDELPDPGRMVDVIKSGHTLFKPGDKYYYYPRRRTNLEVKIDEDDEGKLLVLIDNHPLAGGTFGRQKELCHLNGDYTHWMYVPEIPVEESRKVQKKLLNDMYIKIYGLED